MGKPKNLSPKRREWLEMLASEGPLKSPFTGSVAYGCRVLNWTEWGFMDGSGNLISFSDALAKTNASNLKGLLDLGYRPDPKHREFITEKGRAALMSNRPPLTPE